MHISDKTWTQTAKLDTLFFHVLKHNQSGFPRINKISLGEGQVGILKIAIRLQPKQLMVVAQEEVIPAKNSKKFLDQLILQVLVVKVYIAGRFLKSFSCN